MSHIYVKDLKVKDHKLVYQGPSVLECSAEPDENAVMLGGVDSFGREVIVRMLLSPEEARKIAIDFTELAAEVEDVKSSKQL